MGYFTNLRVTRNLKRLKSDKKKVREKGVWNLVEIKDAEALSPAVDPLIEILKDKHEDSWTRRGAVKALLHAHDFRAVGPFIEAAGDDDREVREEAIEAVGLINLVLRRKGLLPVGIDSLVAAYNDEDIFVKSEAIRALGFTGVGQSLLVEALKHERALVRSTAAEALGYLGDTQSIQPLLEASTDEESFVRESASWALVC